MYKPRIALFVLLCAVLACSGPQFPTATPTSEAAPPATSTASPSAAVTETLPAGNGPCEAASSSEVTIYSRPSAQADVFSSITLSTPEEITSRTADGWLGFEPGTAQAANIGVFRLRWIQPGAPVHLSGNCAALPVAEWLPQPGVCYEMVMGAVDVHTAADAKSAVKATLNVGDFAAILGQTSTGWVSISGDEANRPGVTGFISASDLNVNGPCNAIPTVPG